MNVDVIVPLVVKLGSLFKLSAAVASHKDQYKTEQTFSCQTEEASRFIVSALLNIV